MSTYESFKIPFCKENNELVGGSNYFARQKRIDLNLIGNGVIKHVKGSITKPRNEYVQALSKYMKGDIRD